LLSAVRTLGNETAAPARAADPMNFLLLTDSVLLIIVISLYSIKI